jgi:ABC-type glutathione transport system ATPase component
LLSLRERSQSIDAALMSRQRTLADLHHSSKTWEKRILEIENQITDIQQAVDLAKLCLRERSKIKEDIEQLATLMLQAIFDDSYTFELRPVYADDNPENALVGLKPLILENGVADEPKNYGGGARNIVGFAVQLAFLLVRKDLSPVMILDEPFINLSKTKWDKLIQFIEDLQQDIDFQLIMITHSGIQLPQTFEVLKPAKVSVVTEVD